MRTLTLVTEQLLAPVPGGTARYAQQIGPALVAACPPEWDVRSVTAWHRDVSSARLEGVTGPRRLPAGARGLAALWERRLPPWPGGAVVHALTPLTPAGGRYRRRPLVVTVHDTVPWTHPETLTARGVAWHQKMISIAVADAAAIVVPTQVVAGELELLFPDAAGRLRAVPMGVTQLSTGLTPAAAVARRGQLGLPERFVLIVATLEPRKGLDVLIEAMRDAASDAGRTHLVVVGQQGWGGVSLLDAAAAAGMRAERLHLLGRLRDRDLAAVLAGATVLAAPSRSEGFGLPVLEGFAAGVPVVSSDAPALVEVAAGAAVIVQREDPAALAEALNRVLADDALRSELRRAGMTRAAHFSWPRSARQLWDIYRSLAG